MNTTIADQKLINLFLEAAEIEGLSGTEKEVASFITAFLKKLNLNPFEDKSAQITKGNTGNIICPLGTGGDFVIMSHMDTARSTKGVKPQIKEDRITSDGTSVLGVDNRAGVSCILYAIEYAINNKIPMKDFTVAFSTQEETTSDGAKNLGINGNIKMGFIFDSQSRPGNFTCESVGASGFKIKVRGKASHSGLAPEKGIDSIKIAANALSKIKLGRIDDFTTSNIGRIQGGTAVNVVPETTILEGEVRSIIPATITSKLEEIKTKFEEAAKEAGGEIEFNSKWGFKPYVITQDHEVYNRARKVIANVGLLPVPKISFGGSDANSLNEIGIQSINFGIGARNPHSNEEYILLEDLQKTFEIVLELIKK